MKGMKQVYTFPKHEEVEKEVQYLSKAEVGTPQTPFARTSVLSDKLMGQLDEQNATLNDCIGYYYNAAAMFDSANAFFDRDNIAMPGVAIFFKVAAVENRNCACQLIDFLNKRGARIKFGAVAAPPDDWHVEDMSDVTHAMIKYLAIVKVAYECVNLQQNVATQCSDAHATNFLGNAARALSEKICTASHYLAHLKAIEGDKFALKEFDRQLVYQTEDLAIAVGIESTLPNRLVFGAMNRVLGTQTMDAQRGLFDETSRARIAWRKAALI